MKERWTPSGYSVAHMEVGELLLKPVTRRPKKKKICKDRSREMQWFINFFLMTARLIKIYRFPIYQENSPLTFTALPTTSLSLTSTYANAKFYIPTLLTCLALRATLEFSVLLSCVSSLRTLASSSVSPGSFPKR